MCSIFLELGLKDFLEIREFELNLKIIEIDDKVIVAEADDDLIFFVNEKKYLGPMGIVLKELSNFKELGLKTGETIRIEDRNILLPNGISVDISGAEIVDLRPSEKIATLNEQNVKNNLLHIEEFLYKYGNRGGMLPVVFNLGEYISEMKSESNIKMYNNMYTSLIYTRVISLFEKLIQGRFDKVELCVKDMIDFGTKNNDYSNGFLLGIITAFVYGGMAYDIDMSGIVKLNEMLMKGIDSNGEKFYSTLISKAVDGGSPNIIRNIVRKTVSESDFESLDRSLKQLMKFEQLSGTDVLCGIYEGIKLLEKDKFRISLNAIGQV